MSMDENKGKIKGKGVGGNGNLIPLKKGQTANPNGRPLGQKNYATLYREALIKLAKSEGTTPDELELEILSKGIRSAKSGDYRFYKDLQDRLHGTAIQKTDVTSGGKELFPDEEARVKSREAINEILNAKGTTDIR